MPIRSIAYVLGLACALMATAVTAAPKVSITIKDLTPRFMTFYRAASAPGVTPDERFALWRKDYGFAAVPPTPEGVAISRKLLDGAWAKYPAVLPRIERGAAGIEPSPQQTLTRIADLLQADQPVSITMIVYVGALEGNAFTVGEKGHATVAIPVEESPAERGPAMAHELTHAVQISMGSSSGGWVRSIGETVLAEGLAMRVAQHLYPDRLPASFVEMPDEKGWLKRSDAKRRQILRDVRGAAAVSASDQVMRFTMGVGPSGLDLEAYYAAWLVCGYWLSQVAPTRTLPASPRPTLRARSQRPSTPYWPTISDNPAQPDCARIGHWSRPRSGPSALSLRSIFLPKLKWRRWRRANAQPPSTTFRGPPARAGEQRFQWRLTPSPQREWVHNRRL